MQPVERAMDLFGLQRAVREFADREVPDALVRTVIEAATHAPSGSNTQPWRFLVIRDPEVKRALSREYELAQAERGGRPAPAPAEAQAAAQAAAQADEGILARAPVVIVPCVRVPGRTGVAGFQTGASIYPACQNLMLAARSLGLGTVLTTTHRIRRAEVHALLGIPAGWESAAIIPLGWPDRAYGPNHRGPVDEVICLDHWAE